MDGETGLLLNPAGLVTLGVYLMILVVLGILGARASKEKSMSDFYLSGRGMGLLTLTLTLYATQYSGNTLVGFAAKAYRSGFSFLVSVTFMAGVVGMYMIYAPKLRRLSEKRSYITLADYIQDRFHNRSLTLLVSVSGIVALSNYIISNLKAVGFTFFVATGGEVSTTSGIIIFAIIVLIYETLGGMRSVAWTDVVQGAALFFGCTVIFGVIVNSYGGFGAAMEAVHESRPQFWDAPTLGDVWLWVSTLIVVSVGISIYPHAIQRIYAARDEATLRRAFQIMVFLPLVTTLLMVMVGILGTSRYPDLDAAASESITLLTLHEIATEFPMFQWVVVLFITAVLAAIMSTVDSALLSISSMLTQDIYRLKRPDANQRQLTRFGKRAGWLIMAVAVFLAISLGESIWGLIEIKLELLMQIAPALFLGLHWKRLTGAAALNGFVVGTLVVLFFTVGSVISEAIPKKPLGIHSGLLGLGFNLVILAITQRLIAAPNGPRR